MTVNEAIRTRKSVRKYLDKTVEPEKLRRILEAALLAPSARNLQEWRVVSVTDADTRRRIAEEASGHAFVGEAPVLLAVCAETDLGYMRCGVQRFPVDVSIFIDHITLAAVEEGLGTCWIGGFDADAVKRILGIPENIVVVELLPVGYPADPSPVDKSRLSLSEILHEERW